MNEIFKKEITKEIILEIFEKNILLPSHLYSGKIEILSTLKKVIFENIEKGTLKGDKELLKEMKEYKREGKRYLRMTTHPETLLDNHPIFCHSKIIELGDSTPTLEEISEYDCVIIYG